MMGLAFELLLTESTPARTAAATDLVQATMAMITGQYMDMSFNQRDSVGVEECWEMVSRKTGALLAHAGAVGAILAEAPSQTVEALRRFGQELGLAFQAIDDLLGIWGEPAVTGKPAGNDLRERKKSIPVAVALDSGTRAGEMLADLYAQQHPERGRHRQGGSSGGGGGRARRHRRSGPRLHATGRPCSLHRRPRDAGCRRIAGPGKLRGEPGVLRSPCCPSSGCQATTTFTAYARKPASAVNKSSPSSWA